MAAEGGSARMQSRAIHAYVGLICASGVASLFLLDWSAFWALSDRDLVGLASLTALGLLSESAALTIRFGGSAGHSSITFLPLLACALVFGPAPTVLFIGVTGGIAEFLIRRKEALRASFNLGQYILSTSLAGLAFALLGGEGQATLAATSGSFDFQLIPFALFSITFLLVNQTLVSVAIALHQGVPVRTVLLRVVGSPSGTNILSDLLVAPIAVAVAFLYSELWVTGLFILLLPLLFIRHAYLTYYKLLRANQDLLRALVKAIETRDPYTSGHSMRVAGLAKRIGEGLGLPSKRVESIETAALLHDIGKIDAVFTGILRKDGGLTSEERGVIQSHVQRGVEVLENLASFPVEILDAVRHHHERVDGRGYPEGLQGESIPLAARIINTCDAVDAMLSDRPYRDALGVDEVRRELDRGRGTQFDEITVDAVLTGDLLESHAAKVRAAAAEPEATFVVEAVAAQAPAWFSKTRRLRRQRSAPVDVRAAPKESPEP